jgi:predicted DNA-binding transcriptional regulator AlpA
MRKVYGIKEIAQALGERRQTVSVWHQRGKLPTPTEVLSTGPVWLSGAIEPWIAAWREERARRGGEAEQ